MEYNSYGLEFARSVVSNPHPYFARARAKHPEPDMEWIELASPHKSGFDNEHTGRLICYGYIPEAGNGKWLVVIAQNEQLFNAYFSRDLLRSWGRPE